jgi:hypothetical protein
VGEAAADWAPSLVNEEEGDAAADAAAADGGGGGEAAAAARLFSFCSSFQRWEMELVERKG